MPEHDMVVSNRNSKDRKIIVLPCVHVPFQNREFLDKAIKLAGDIQVEEVVIAGDFIDCNALGDFERGKLSRTGITLEEEYFEANLVLDKIDLAVPDAKKTYLFGNHENRYWRWKNDVNNSKYGDIMNPIRALKLEDRGYNVLSDYKNDYYEVGSLQIFHGEYYNIHVAKKNLDTFRRNNMFAHTHRVQYYREGDFGSWNIGWMGDKNSPAFEYATRAMKESWANAFSLITIDSHEKHHVKIIEYINGAFYNGTIRY